MILVDTSVWISHLREGNEGLKRLLNDADVLCHPFIIGELACGNLKNRREILALLRDLPMAAKIEHEDIMDFIDNHKLMGKGIGYIDVHLLAAAMLSEAPLWTLDKRLDRVASEIGISFDGTK